MSKRRFSPCLEAMEFRFTPTSGATAAVADVVAPPAQAATTNDDGAAVDSNGVPIAPDFLYTDPDPNDYSNTTASYLMAD